MSLDRFAELALSYADYYPVLFILPFLFLQWAYRARAQKAPRHWPIYALALSAAIFGITLQVGALWFMAFDAMGLSGSLFDGAALGVWGGAAVGILVYEFVHYWYHRADHTFDFMWRMGHQLHHSAESLDVYGAFWIHPIDATLFTTWAILVFVPLLGLAPESAAIAAAFLSFNAVFQHADIKTPHWLGYLIQRPESHAVHHGQGIHRHNYSDLPLWDMVFGTFRNPKADEVPTQSGFYMGASERMWEMFTFQDVSEPLSESDYQSDLRTADMRAGSR